jgi:hypothetical protein
MRNADSQAPDCSLVPADGEHRQSLSGTPRPHQETAASPYRFLDVHQKTGRDRGESGHGHIVSMLSRRRSAH